MSRDEFVWKIEHGDDIMFDINGRKFVIFTWDEDGIRIVEQNSNSDGLVYKEANELLDKFLVDGIPLKEVVGDITITAYTLVRE